MEHQIPSTNNSMTQFLQQLLRIQRNSMEIIGKLTQITKSDAQSIFIELEDQYGVSQQYELPTIGALKNDIERIDNNFKLISGNDGEDVTVKLSDGSYRKIVQASLHKEPEIIESLNVPSTFNRKNNWFFESFLNPLLYVTFDITDYVEYDTRHVSCKRIILNDTGEEVRQYFDNSLKGRNDISYDDLLKDFKNRDISYFVDEDIIALPISIPRYSGTFSVISYSDEIITSIKDENTIQEKIRKYKLNTLKYTDNLQKYKNTEILKPKDTLDVGKTTRYEVVSVNTSDNTVILKRTSGVEPIPIKVDSLKISLNAFSIKEAQINIGFNERQIIFIKIIDRNSNLTTREFSPGVAFFSNDLVTDTPKGTISLSDFYKKEVIDFGASLMMLGKEGSIPAIYGEIPDSPRLDPSNFKVIEINKQKSDSKVISELKNKISQKNTLSSEITQLQVAIDKKRQEFNTSKFNSDTERQAVQNQLENLIRQKASSSNLYASIIADLSSISKNRPSELDKPKYRVRGFFPIPKGKISHRTLDQEIIQFIISYRYLRTDGTSAGTEQLDFIDNTGEKVRGYFSNWNEVTTKIRNKVYDEELGIYVWSSEEIDDADSLNINQIDIPITKGEQIEIRIKSVSEAGWPHNPLTSDWSSSIIIPFPADLGTDDEINEALISSALEEIRVNFNQDLAARGIDTHISSSFIQKDRYYSHSSTDIASGFFNGDGSIINLYQKIVELDNEISKLRATIEKAKGKLSIHVVDLDGEKINISNNSTVNLFAGYYEDIVKTLPSAQRKGAIITNVYNLVIQNSAASPLHLVSLFPGGLDQELLDSKTVTDNDEYKNSRQYDIVPLSLSSVNIDKISNFDANSNRVPYQAAPFQSSQRRSQFLYLRSTDIGLVHKIVDQESDYTADNSYYPIVEGNTRMPFIWNPSVGESGGGYLTDFCVHNAHPSALSFDSPDVSILDELNNPLKTGEEFVAPAKYPIFTHSKTFNKQSQEENGIVQTGLCRPRLDSNDPANKYPVKLGFYTDDRYLIGKNTCGSYLYIAPPSYSDILIDGTDYKAYKEVEFGEQFHITIPIVFQYRMTDFYGEGDEGTGRIGGTVDLKNLHYSKKIGIDIYVKDETVFSFDVEVSAKYKADSPSQTKVKTTRVNTLRSSQLSKINKIF